MEQVIEQLEAQTYAAPDAPRYSYALFENERGERTVLLTAPDGELLVSIGERVVSLADVAGPDAVGLEDDASFRLEVAVDDDGNVVQIGDARRLERREVLQRLTALQQLRLDMDGTPLQLVRLANGGPMVMAHGSRVAMSRDLGESWTVLSGSWEQGVVRGMELDGERVVLAIESTHRS